MLDELVPSACHITEQYGGSSNSAAHAVITAGHAFIQNICRVHYELGDEEIVNLWVLTAFDELVMAI
ncbi:MAG: hypothetical protein JO281_01595 [Pseudonocardiales bacterium]|nr:hypothetical protein [Pseudonocardiales bacterium]